ncbi:unnamed protein product [Acanthoscelides obtectus]|uniref:Uncharacterized protein n=1 Tax=Acanthoscelides obtectus TaxID=200917 RepID=A0A9P0Q3M8_ACAOB|nr:unnamed protein product [Acanthoscelides obtectus]CAK1655707.1 hypothetical protein AOBTE_LOCUS19273 [Acanthoscelides obtectus]
MSRGIAKVFLRKFGRVHELQQSNPEVGEVLQITEEEIHPNLAKNSVGLGGRSKETINRKRDELAICLNTHGSGATKNEQCWRRVSMLQFFIHPFVIANS